MSESELKLELRVRTAEWTAAMDRVQRTLGEAFLPSVRRMVDDLNRFWRSYPGMPYTAPSLWDPEQMVGDRSPVDWRGAVVFASVLAAIVFGSFRHPSL